MTPMVWLHCTFGSSELFGCLELLPDQVCIRMNITLCPLQLLNTVLIRVVWYCLLVKAGCRTEF